MEWGELGANQSDSSMEISISLGNGLWIGSGNGSVIGSRNGFGGMVYEMGNPLGISSGCLNLSRCTIFSRAL